jgi:hypothetical protein
MSTHLREPEDVPSGVLLVEQRLRLGESQATDLRR